MRTPRPKSKGYSAEFSSAGKARLYSFTMKMGMTSLKWFIKQLEPSFRRKHTISSIPRQPSLGSVLSPGGSAEKSREQPGQEVSRCCRCFPPTMESREAGVTREGRLRWQILLLTSPPPGWRRTSLGANFFSSKFIPSAFAPIPQQQATGRWHIPS